MSKVVIEAGEGHGENRLFVDGVEIGKAVKADGLRLMWEKDRPVLELVLIPSELHVDLPDAVIEKMEAL